MRFLRLLGLLGGLGLALGAAASADFAASPGFSGRQADCSACHRPPLQGDDATISVDGLPDAWDRDARSRLTVRIEGGPVSLPTGPQAGFEIEAEAGTFATDAADGVRSFFPAEATYTEDGVFQRAWNLTWVAPGLLGRPTDVTFWAAGIAANGNHDTRLNASDLGEHGDSVATLVVTVPPSEAALDAWRALPLRPPVVDEVRRVEGGSQIKGRLPDANATEIQVHEGDGWRSHEAGTQWLLRTQADAVRLRAAGSERVSAEVVVDLAGDARSTPPAPGVGGAVAALALAALLRRRP